MRPLRSLRKATTSTVPTERRMSSTSSVSISNTPCAACRARAVDPADHGEPVGKELGMTRARRRFRAVRTRVGLLIDRPIHLVGIDTSTSNEIGGGGVGARVRIGVLQPTGVGHQRDERQPRGQLASGSPPSCRIRSTASRPVAAAADVMELGIPVVLGAVEGVMIHDHSAAKPGGRARCPSHRDDRVVSNRRRSKGRAPEASLDRRTRTRMSRLRESHTDHRADREVPNRLACPGRADLARSQSRHQVNRHRREGAQQPTRAGCYG